MERRRLPIASLIVAVLCLTIALGVLIFVPQAAPDSGRATIGVTPGTVVLPPTVVPSATTPR